MIATHTERLRALATALACPGADPLALARQLARLADELDQAAAVAARRTQGAARPALSGSERLFLPPRRNTP